MADDHDEGSRVRPINSIGSSEPSTHRAAIGISIMALAGLAVLIFGLDATVEPQAEPELVAQSSTTTASDQGDGFAACDPTPLAEWLAQEPPNANTWPSDSIAALTERNALIVRGLIISFEPRAKNEVEGTVIVVQLSHATLPPARSVNGHFSLWVPLQFQPTAILRAEFVAFLTGEQVHHPTGTGQAAWQFHTEGLWISCETESPTEPVFGQPEGFGWDAILAGRPTIDELWTLAITRQGSTEEPLGEPSLVESGVAVYDLLLIDGGRFRLSLPALLASDDLTLIQRPGPSPVLIVGRSAMITIAFDLCRNQSGMWVNRLGSTVVVSDDGVRVCRPDELIAMQVATSNIAFPPEAHDAFDLRPIYVAGQYGAAVNRASPHLADCSNCAPRGPLLFPDMDLVVNRTGDTAVTGVDLGALQEIWTWDIGGFSALIHGGPFLRLDPATGIEEWRIDRDPGESESGLSGHGGETWFLRSSFHIEGDDRAPILRRINPETGELLWTANGRQGTEWQSSRAVVISGLVVLMDRPNNPQLPIAPAGGALHAYDAETGRPAWTTDLKSPSDVYGYGLVAVLDFEEGPALIVDTVDGDIVRVDPANGAVLWRTAVSEGRIGGTDLAPDGSIAIDIQTLQGHLLLDPASGERFGS